MALGKDYEPPIGPLEVFLIEIVIYMAMWMYNDYLASLLSLILTCISFMILLVSLGVELIEKSRVPRWYYYFMAASVLAPVLSGLVYYFISGELNWVVNPFF
ncbi:hypothetical protein [Flavilitoribacter nigricans]|uniref:Uncharacterized protein n=1 Tax=Flavilitoribacter nigricans (strain ATCC 23147 / DSM 23189 / NBRC 102662 / NCIMB 1420 / SS-2) TaxID=1122177 RepID=A0A2D0N7K5_FLAN2|nr:hypothetical protein [Flavilitoribacter nigricans]PHN04502.1 hypothetical protein CRP01_21080 [Flavilitoribacter nigricans DSM 23189 = NBRC 102662]